MGFALIVLQNLKNVVQNLDSKWSRHRDIITMACGPSDDSDMTGHCPVQLVSRR